MADIIDINVNKTVEDVTINVTEEVIQVNINTVTGGGIESVTGTAVDNTDPLNPIVNNAVDSVNSQTGVVSIDLQSVTDEGNVTSNEIISETVVIGPDGNFYAKLKPNGTVEVYSPDNLNLVNFNPDNITRNGIIYEYPNTATSRIATLLDIPSVTPQDLQSVLNEGDTAEDSIIELTSSTTTDKVELNNNYLYVGDDAEFIQIEKNKITHEETFRTELVFTEATANRVITFKDESGTVALTSDVENTQTNYTNNFLLGGM